MMLLLLACGSPEVAAPVEPSFVEVTLGTEQIGTADAPLPFPTAGETWPVTVRTLDRDQQPYSVDLDLTLDVHPGDVVGDPVVSLVDGEWSGEVTIEHAFGPTRIWASDEGDRDIDSTRVASWATGVTEAIWYDRPTLAEMQATDDPETNATAGEYVALRVADREVVVTAVTTNGFWVTDVMDEPGTGNSVFIYTFSKPDDEFVPGASVTGLSGIDQEYLATTQLYWPTLTAGEATYPVPDAIPLDPSFACDEVEMELLESSRVEALGWQIPASFTQDSDAYADFEEYGQWPLTLGDCTIYAESGATVPDFFPPDHAGETLPRVSGMAKEIFGTIVLTVLDETDLEYASSGPHERHATRRPSPPNNPHSRADWLR